MKSTLAAIVCFVLCLCLSASPALATGEKCKNVFVRVDAALYSCPPGPTEGCIDTPIRGTLNGTWFFYYPADNFVQVFDPMPNHPGFAAGWGRSTMETNRGDLFTRDTWVFDNADFAGFLWFTQTFVVTGGTGVYEGATGHLGFIGDEFAGIIRGEICTPK